jgi:hypothetical protein
VANPNVSNLYKAWQTAAYFATAKPSYLAGVLLNHPSEREELDVLLAMMFSEEPMTALYGNRSVKSVETNGRFIPAYTMDTVGGLASVAANTDFTFKSIQGSTDSTGTFTLFRVGEEILNPLNSQVAKIRSIVINGVDDVDVTARATGTDRWVDAATTMPAGTTIVNLGVSRAEISDSTTTSRTDFLVYDWYVKEMRETFQMSGRDAAANLSWVTGPDGGEGIYLNSQIITFSEKVRQFQNRQRAFADPDYTQFNALDPGFGGNTLSVGLFPYMLGRSAHPGSISQPTGGNPTLATIEAVIRQLDANDVANTNEYVMLMDREFSFKWSNLIKSNGGTFDLWEFAGLDMAKEKGLDLDFNTLVYGGKKFHGKYLPMLSGGAGLNVTNGLYNNIAFGIPRKKVYDAAIGRNMPAVQIFHSTGGNGYSRLKNMWAHGNPHLVAQMPGAKSPEPGSSYPMGTHGRDEISFECQWEEGLVFRGMSMDSFIMPRS